MAQNDSKAGVEKRSFFDGVKAEFGKIAWSSREVIAKKTLLVVVITVILGVIISIVDNAALQLFRLLIG